MINIIFASTFEGIIGKDNKLPWNIPEELGLFKQLTLNSTIIMGRKTFESLPKILPNRKHIILTRNTNYKVNDNENVKVIYEINEIIKKYFNNHDEDCWVIGGSEIINIFINKADNLHISWILQNYEGNTYINAIPFSNFKLISEKKYDKFIYRNYRRLNK